MTDHIAAVGDPLPEITGCGSRSVTYGDSGTKCSTWETRLTSIADRLFTELDRQLTEIRTIADGIAARAGFLTSATAVAAGLMGSRLSTLAGNPWTITALVAFGVAALFGIGAVAPSMYVGMKSSRLTYWVNAPSGDAEQKTKDIFAEKIVVLEKNATLLTVVRVLCYSQGVAVILAIVAALIAAGHA